MKLREGSVRLVGVAALLAGVVSAAVVAVDGTGRIEGAIASDQPTIYGPAQTTLSAGLVVAGLLLLLAARGRVAAAALTGVVGLLSAQLAATGLVAYRRWPLYWGCCTPEAVTEQELVRTLALLIAVVCGLTALASVVLLFAARYAVWTGASFAVAVAMAAGLTVALAGPPLVAMGGGWASDVKDLVAVALMYSLPLGIALALSSLMPRLAALTMAGAVAASVLATTLGEPSFFEFGDARVLVAVSAAVVAATRLVRLPDKAATEPAQVLH